MAMKRVCAWCDSGLEPSGPAPDDEATPITHGICPACVLKMMSDEAKPLRSYLDQFAAPVFVLGERVQVVTANSAGLSMLNRPPTEIEGTLAGDALDCVYARRPGGCGGTSHCKTCTIRHAVTDTLLTGRSNRRVEAYPDLHFITGETEVKFLITTEKVGAVVLLRIDEVTKI